MLEAMNGYRGQPNDLANRYVGLDMKKKTTNVME